MIYSLDVLKVLAEKVAKPERYRGQGELPERVGILK